MVMFMRRINLITRCQGLYRTDRLPDAGLRPIHHSMIFAICRNPGISQEELASQVCLNKSTITRQLAPLEEQGYVERKQSESDKRVIHVFPTQKMKDILPTIRQITMDWNAYLTEGFSEEELAQFSAMLDKITERAQKYAEERTE